MFRGTIVFVHGYTASSKGDWYPQISTLLDQAGVAYKIPDLPGGEYPHAQEWLSIIDDVVKESEGPLVLVGHSLGTRAVLLYIEKYQPKVEKVFLIATFDDLLDNANRHDDGKGYADFFEQHMDIHILKKSVGGFVVVHSKDDSSIEYTQAEGIAAKLDAKLMMVDGRDHMSESENAEFIFEILKEELGF